jgi:hypothetical protein
MDNEVAGVFGILFFVLIFFVVIIAITIIPYWKIYQRTGQSGAISLLQLIPVINIIMLYVLAFSAWPIEDELKRAQQKLYELEKARQLHG